MRYLFLFLLLLPFSNLLMARHIKGGWVQYEYKGANGTGKSDYTITVYVFKDCTQPGPMPTALGIYDGVTFAAAQIITNISFTLLSQPTKTTYDPCLSNRPSICYQVYTYTTTVTLTDSDNGYLIAASDANRVTGIVNITNSQTTGISFTATIPGKINSVDYHINTSPFFQFKDTAVICYSGKFNYQFAAQDADGDSLSYAFGNGLNGTQTLSSPPYSALTYSTSFSGTSPLGGNATINPTSGLISGIAPATTGEYVITVYVSEWRNGVKINATKKELQITVANCSLSAASLKVSYINCNDYTFQFQNESSATNITSYQWDFGDVSAPVHTSTQPTPTYTYSGAGTFNLTLNVSNAGGCKDSAKATVKVYPGFKAAFSVAGSCYQTPFIFTNSSTTNYGFIDSYQWDFGDAASTNDTSSLKNPTYQYGSAGNVTATLYITSNLGCSATASMQVVVNNKPQIILPFKDTLICSIDTLMLKAQSNAGTFQWSPNTFLLNPNSATPLVYPKDTTRYTVTVTDKGCIDSATITVNVLDFITVKLATDTGICATDTITLRPISDALSYQWTETSTTNTMNSKAVKYPKVAPVATNTYFVTANLGKCQDRSSITVHTSPYPSAHINLVSPICFGNKVQLTGNYTGAFYEWLPASSLFYTNSLTPVAAPSVTTKYMLAAKDTFYCPKIVTDTVTVKVIPPYVINAGHDTSVVVYQPLQLKTISDTSLMLTYKWTPSNYLDSANKQNPIAVFDANTPDKVRLVVTAATPEGCTSTDDIWITVFKSLPDILVPSAFTPNNDGRNDVLKPILIGINQLNYFNVYNRWGQMIYSTSQPGAGWDGNVNGTAQPASTFVFTASGVDYTGKPIIKKGTVVLIR